MDSWAIGFFILFVLMALTETGRAGLAFFFGRNGPGQKIFAFVAGVLFAIYNDHILILKNFAPRRVVIKTLEKKRK